MVLVGASGPEKTKAMNRIRPPRLNYRQYLLPSLRPSLNDNPNPREVLISKAQRTAPPMLTLCQGRLSHSMHPTQCHTTKCHMHTLHTHKCTIHPPMRNHRLQEVALQCHLRAQHLIPLNRLHPLRRLLSNHNTQHTRIHLRLHIHPPPTLSSLSRSPNSSININMSRRILILPILHGHTLATNTNKVQTNLSKHPHQISATNPPAKIPKASKMGKHDPS